MCSMHREWAKSTQGRGGSRIYFRRGCTRLLVYFNTNKPHSFIFGRIPVVLENRRSSRGGGGCVPPHPPHRSAPARATKWKQDTSVAFAKWHCAELAVTMTSTQGHNTFLFMNTNLAG